MLVLGPLTLSGAKGKDGNAFIKAQVITGCEVSIKESSFNGLMVITFAGSNRPFLNNQTTYFVTCLVVCVVL